MVAFLYLARPVVLPIILACVGGMALKPLIRWLSKCHIPPALSAAVVLLLLVAVAMIGYRFSIQFNDSYALRDRPAAREGSPELKLHQALVPNMSGSPNPDVQRCPECGEL